MNIIKCKINFIFFLNRKYWNAISYIYIDDMI